jgi:hypothetical protein
MSTTANRFLWGCLSCTTHPTHQFSSMWVIRERSAIHVSSKVSVQTTLGHHVFVQYIASYKSYKMCHKYIWKFSDASVKNRTKIYKYVTAFWANGSKLDSNKMQRRHALHNLDKIQVRLKKSSRKMLNQLPQQMGVLVLMA